MAVFKKMRVLSVVFRGSVIVVASQLLWACATLENILPVVEDQSIENQRATIAMASLRELENVDMYIKLDNTRLRNQIRDSLQAQASETERFKFSSLKVRFAKQAIFLKAGLQISNGDAEPLPASLLGDVILVFSGNQLIWLPHFNQLDVSATEFVFEEQAYPEMTEELAERLLGQVNEEITDAVIVLGRNGIQINPVPLGDIEVGATLTNWGNVTASKSQKLGGVYTVAGSTILIEPKVTSIALDLDFIPNISDCPADIYVSRSTFAREIRNREPIGVTRLPGEGANEVHFFTEISGATRSTAIIHYWFANGQPVALEELQVEPSFRWRTWSSKIIDPSLARNWEAIVVEKETGCILHSLAIRTDPVLKPASTGEAPVLETFEQFKNEFEEKVAGFSILEDRPKVALIEVPRPFLKDVLHASLKDIQVTVDFDIDDLPAQRIPGSLQPLNVDDIICEERDCTTQRACDTGFSQCTRQRDSRDCTTCLFRNPLNNRCVNEAIDPICEAAKTNQNAKYESARVACERRETNERLDCERQQTLEIRSCDIEATFEKSTCELGREIVRESQDSGPFADIFVKLKTSGGITATFSGFAIEGDLSDMRLDLNFSGAFDLSGIIRFAPKQALGPLASCIDAWQKSLTGTVMLPHLAHSMFGTIRSKPTGLVTNWSGYVANASINPSPLQAMFVEKPNLLADCNIGLTAYRVAEATLGENSDYLRGRFNFEIQPSPSRIDFANASVQYGDQVFEAQPELSATHLRYEIRE